MGLTVGSDAYATAQEVGEYLTSRGIEGWGEDAAKQEAAIREATAYLDASFSWVGRVDSREQLLGWPRVNAYDREGRYMTGIPAPVKAATAELAFLAMRGRLQPMQLPDSEGMRIKSDEISGVRTTYEYTGSITPDYSFIRGILRGLGSFQDGDGITVSLRRA